MSKYSMRSLKTTDFFKMSKILKKLNVKTDEIKIHKDTSQMQVGIVLFQKALENLYQAEDEVNAFLGDLVGIGAEEFKELPIEETLEIITLFKEQKGIMDFLKAAGKLTT